MKRVLKNMLRGNLEIKGFPRGKDSVWIKSKSAKVFDMDIEEERKEYYLWLRRYGKDAGGEIVIDITTKLPEYNDQPEIKHLKI